MTRPATKRESMAACLLAAEHEILWRQALDRLRDDADKTPAAYWLRLADQAIAHIPYVEKLATEEWAEAEQALIDAIQQCARMMPRERVAKVLGWHSFHACKGPLTGDTEHLGTPYQETEA